MSGKSYYAIVKSKYFAFKSTLLALVFAATLSACGGGANAQTPGSRTVGFTTLMPQMVALIARRYSSSPDLKRAAEGWARAEGANMQSAATMGVYNEVLSLKAANAQSCLLSRAYRSGAEITYHDNADFAAAMTPTPKLFSAYWKADSLASGHPEEINGEEALACAAGGIQ